MKARISCIILFDQQYSGKSSGLDTRDLNFNSCSETSDMPLGSLGLSFPVCKQENEKTLKRIPRGTIL